MSCRGLLGGPRTIAHTHTLMNTCPGLRWENTSGPQCQEAWGGREKMLPHAPAPTSLRLVLKEQAEVRLLVMFAAPWMLAAAPVSSHLMFTFLFCLLQIIFIFFLPVKWDWRVVVAALAHMQWHLFSSSPSLSPPLSQSLPPHPLSFSVVHNPPF